MPNVGEVRKIVATFKNEAGALANPDTVTAKYVKPSGASVTLAPEVGSAFVQESTGRYVLRILLDLAGTYKVRISGTSVALTGVNASAKTAFRAESNEV